MHKISDEYLEEHENEMIKCPKCGHTDVIAKMDIFGYINVINVDMLRIINQASDLQKPGLGYSF